MERKGNFWLKGCSRCRGDLFLEELDWRCLQCGTYYYDTNPLGFLGREGVWGTNARVTSYRAGRVGPDQVAPDWAKDAEGRSPLTRRRAYRILRAKSPALR